MEHQPPSPEENQPQDQPPSSEKHPQNQTPEKTKPSPKDTFPSKESSKEPSTKPSSPPTPSSKEATSPLFPSEDAPTPIESEKISTEQLKALERFQQLLLQHKKGISIASICGLACLFLGLWLGGLGAPSTQKTTAKGDDGVLFWSCAMHPQVQQPGPGKCPICGMDLIPIRFVQEEGPVLRMSERGKKLAQVQTAPVLYRRLSHKVRLYGKITYDETLLHYITMRFPGRIDALYVDFTGAHVRKGDHLAYIYSPELRSAQEELLSDIQAYKEALKTKDPLNIQLAKKKMEASRKKLELWDIPPQEIEKIIQSGKTQDHITIYSTVEGTVIHKDAVIGRYQKEGDKIYTIANLKRVWLFLDAYESDLVWLGYGQKVIFEVEAYPGRKFEGRIAYIDPFLNNKTRTVTVRVEVPNEHLLLKPNMLAIATIEAQVASDGTLVSQELQGKWICPMHPYETTTKPGQTCSRCGMKLEPAQTLGFVSLQPKKSRVLTIPATAPLITGKRAVVYVEDPNDPSKYIGRVIELGPRAGDYYVVKSGLVEGEKVVVHGAFQIDSSLQIMARPSMMSPPKKKKKNSVPIFAIANAPYHKEMEPVLRQYFRIQQALSQNEQKKLALLKKQLLAKLQNLHFEKMTQLPLSSKTKLKKLVKKLLQSVQKADSSKLKAFRNAFAKWTKILEEYLLHFGHTLPQPIYKAFCPMAFKNKGGYWLQIQKEIQNAYMGTEMLTCGSIKNTFPPLPPKAIGDMAFVQDNLSPYFRRSFHKFSQKIIENYLKIHRKIYQKKTNLSTERLQILKLIFEFQPKKHFPKKELPTVQRILEAMRWAVLDLRGKKIQEIRRDFLDFSTALKAWIERFGHTYPKPLYLYNCTKYRRGLGGHWLQSAFAPKDPYQPGDNPVLEQTFAPYRARRNPF
ncbi:MAG: DUF3347 domain-containing protein [Planctomycetota bacterium]|nr:MAG: DUF3347 domain-containing protein [Planctomycetota bacterium]